jgi:hypothetical protein
MLSLKIVPVISFISILKNILFGNSIFSLQSFDYLENLLIQLDFSFIDYIVINNANIDIIPTE